MPSLIITTIFPPNAVMRELAAGASKHGWDFIIAGDTKSPADFHLDGATFLDIETQRGMGEYGQICPVRSYARKNLAYLEAIRRGADCIIETDDDNMPLPAFWQPPTREITGRHIDTPGWVNAYQFFSDTFIYPRGFPIDLALPHWQAGSESRSSASSDYATTSQKSEVGDQKSTTECSETACQTSFIALPAINNQQSAIPPSSPENCKLKTFPPPPSNNHLLTTILMLMRFTGCYILCLSSSDRTIL